MSSELAIKRPLAFHLGGVTFLVLLTLSTEAAAVYDGSPTVAGAVGIIATAALFIALRWFK